MTLPTPFPHGAAAQAAEEESATTAQEQLAIRQSVTAALQTINRLEVLLQRRLERLRDCDHQ